MPLESARFSAFSTVAPYVMHSRCFHHGFELSEEGKGSISRVGCERSLRVNVGVISLRYGQLSRVVLRLGIASVITFK